MDPEIFLPRLARVDIDFRAPMVLRDVLNFDDEEILRILNQKKPSYFILENVKGILNMGGYDTELDKKNKTGRIVKNIVKELEMCGYKVQYK